MRVLDQHLCGPFLLLSACGMNAQFEDPEARAAISREATSRTTSFNDEVAEHERELRRDYGARDLELAPCASLTEGDAINANGCANGIVTFGPYFSAPAASDVFVSFEITPSAPLFVASDIVSGGKYFHAAMDLVAVEPGAARHVGYKVHLFEAATGIEARIGIQATTPGAFQLSNVRIAVQ